jgi:hypothetical protein
MDSAIDCNTSPYNSVNLQMGVSGNFVGKNVNDNQYRIQNYNLTNTQNPLVLEQLARQSNKKDEKSTSETVTKQNLDNLASLCEETIIPEGEEGDDFDLNDLEGLDFDAAMADFE